VILETDCLPLLGMIANCDTPDIAMLRWIVFIRMFNPELRHIAGKDNPIADMLSRARYSFSLEADDKDGLCMATTSEEDYEQLDFCEDLYSGELVQIGRYISTLEKDPQWNADTFNRIRKKSYQFMLRDGVLWRHPKKKDIYFYGLLALIRKSKRFCNIYMTLTQQDTKAERLLARQSRDCIGGQACMWMLVSMWKPARFANCIPRLSIEMD
jgi:hypothetical protein